MRVIFSSRCEPGHLVIAAQQCAVQMLSKENVAACDKNSLATSTSLHSTECAPEPADVLLQATWHGYLPRFGHKPHATSKQKLYTDLPTAARRPSVASNACHLTATQQLLASSIATTLLRQLTWPSTDLILCHARILLDTRPYLLAVVLLLAFCLAATLPLQLAWLVANLALRNAGLWSKALLLAAAPEGRQALCTAAAHLRRLPWPSTDLVLGHAGLFGKARHSGAAQQRLALGLAAAPASWLAGLSTCSLFRDALLLRLHAHAAGARFGGEAFPGISN